MGKGDTELVIQSPKAGRAVLKAWFTPGPSLPDKPDRHILIFNNVFETHMLISRDGPDSFSVPVNKGLNRIFLRVLDKPTISCLPSGDSRPLIVGVQGLKINFAEYYHVS